MCRVYAIDSSPIHQMGPAPSPPPSIVDSTTAQMKSESFRAQRQVNEGDGAFYRPKIDTNVSDALNMKFQCATLQIDFQLPARFELYYSAEGEEGKKEAPVMIRIAIFGSVERSLAITVANPTDLVKVRLRAEKKLPPGAPRRYSGTLNASSTILRQEGVGVLWTGIGPNIACNAMINAAELARYDQVKQTLLKILGLKAMLSLIFLLVWGSVWIKDGQIWYLSLDNNVGYRFQTKQMY